MFRRVVNFEAIGPALGLLRCKRLLTTGGRGRVELIHDQHQRGCFPIRSCKQVRHKVGPVTPPSVVSDGHVPPPGQGFAGHKEAGDTVPHRHAVLALERAGRDGQRFVHFPEEWPEGFVHANDRALRVGWLWIDGQHVFPGIDKLSGLLGRKAPPLPPRGLAFVFGRACRTLSCETLSTIRSSTAGSASKRRVPRAFPSGGARPASAINGASGAPSKARS
jgi:hypothetical protein